MSAATIALTLKNPCAVPRSLRSINRCSMAFRTSSASSLWSAARVIASLAKYKIAYQDDESTESLTTKLAEFYANRTLTKSPITPGDQAEAIFLLLTNRLSKTTGQVITVDGGLHEAFLR